MLKERIYYEQLYELLLYSKDKQTIWETNGYKTLKESLENLAEYIEENKNEQFYFEIRFVKNYVIKCGKDKETENLENKLVISGYTKKLK